MMDFDTLLQYLGDNYEGTTVFSVEVREMTTHETTIMYFMEEQDALRYAEQLWQPLTQDERDYREISVHRGEIQYQELSNTYRFLVLQKLFKAYKKLYVCQDFSDQFKANRKAELITTGFTEEDAAIQARKEFNEQYAIQPVIKFGMFAGYSYAPKMD